MKTKDEIKTEEEAREIKNQVENYHTLGITKSSRGQVVLVFGGLYLLSFVLSLFGIIELSDLFWSLIIYIPVLIFVYKGHRWAMVTLMILWTIEKVYTAYLTVENQAGSVWGSIIWLIIGLGVIYKALKVENERRSLLPAPATHGTGSFCRECGTKQENGSRFCAKCGTATN